MKRFIPTLTLVVGLAGCTTSSNVKLTESMASDTAYASALEKSHREEKAIRNFETKTNLNVTRLDPEFLQAYDTRLRKVFDETESTLVQDVGGHTGFFVSLYSDEYDQLKLDNKSLWNIVLKKDGKVFRPVFIRQLSNKPLWKEFFPGITSWTNEYLVAFDLKNTPSTSTSSEQTESFSDSNTELVFANAYANISFKW